MKSSKGAEQWERWAQEQLWTFVEAAHLLAGEFPPPRDVLSSGASEAVKSWYREIKDAADLGAFKWVEQRINYIGNRRVKPTDCIAWARTRGKALPPELASLVPQPADTSRLNPKDKESLMTLVITMALAGYKYDPRAKKSEVVGEIVSDAARCGLTITDDTVRKWLKKSSELVSEQTLASVLNKAK